MGREGELAKNTFIIAAGKLSAQAVAFLMLPVYTSYLSPREFGTFELAMLYGVMLAPVLTLQLESAVFRFLIDSRLDAERRRAIVSSAFAAVTVILLVALCVLLVLGMILSVPYLGWCAAVVASFAFSNLTQQILRGMGDNLRFSIAGALAAAVTTVCSVALLWRGWSVGGMLLAVVIGNVVATVYAASAMRLHRSVRRHWADRKVARDLISYSAPLVPNGVSWWLVEASGALVISVFLGLAANGIYAIANKFYIAFLQVHTYFYLAWTESASLHIDADDRDEYFSRVANWVLAIFGSFAMLIVAAMPFAFEILVNDTFAEARIYIPMIMLGGVFFVIVAFYGSIYVAKMMTRSIMNTTIISGVLAIAGGVAFVREFGIWAPVMSTAVAWAVLAAYRHFGLRNDIRISYRLETVVGLVLGFGGTCVCYYLADGKPGWVAAGGVAYALGVSVVLNRSLLMRAYSHVRVRLST